MTRGLREENERLRQMLKRAEDLAARYTIMLREGDHRIKNSLQIVSGLMHLQARREGSPSARDALNAAAARIQSVGRMHDALQSTGGEDGVDLGAIIETMCKSLQDMGGAPLGVAVGVRAEALSAPVAFAQPIALAVNELVVNALRHAFPDGRSGEIRVSLLRANGQVRVTVDDNGVGLPENYSQTRGYGMRLVRTMVAQIGGVLDVDISAGARFTIIAPSPASVGPGLAAAETTGLPDAKSAWQAKVFRSPFKLPARKPWNASGRG